RAITLFWRNAMVFEPYCELIATSSPRLTADDIDDTIVWPVMLDSPREFLAHIGPLRRPPTVKLNLPQINPRAYKFTSGDRVEAAVAALRRLMLTKLRRQLGRHVVATEPESEFVSLLSFEATISHERGRERLWNISSWDYCPPAPYNCAWAWGILRES